MVITEGKGIVGGLRKSTLKKLKEGHIGNKEGKLRKKVEKTEE
jgi:hypothetical protein